MWPGQPEADAIACAGGKIVWIGRGEDAPTMDREIDACKQTVLPGLIDAHSHLYWMALDRLEIRVDPSQISSIDDLIERLRSVAKSKPPGEWIVAVGINEFALSERKLPTRDDLDRISTAHPIAVKRLCGHAAVVNSRALGSLGITDDTVNPYGGIIERNGLRATGILRERMAEALFQILPIPRTEDIITSLRQVASQYHACGVTGATEAAVGFTSGFDREWNVWSSLRSSGDYPLRMAFMLGLTAKEADARELKPSGRDIDWQVDTIKFFADGTFGSRTASVSQPYEGGGESRGLLMQPDENLREEMLRASGAGWNVAVHAIGDRAIDLVVDTFAAIKKRGAIQRRHRIEHFALPSKQALSAVAALDIAIVPQYGFLRAMGDGFLTALGRERADRLYPGKSLVETGAVIAGSSDAPATPISPFVGIAAAMNRKSVSGHPLGPREGLTGEQAVQTYTEGAARILGHENDRGILRPGATADLIIVDRDVFEADAEQVLETKVAATFLRGEIVFERQE